MDNFYTNLLLRFSFSRSLNAIFNISSSPYSYFLIFVLQNERNNGRLKDIHLIFQCSVILNNTFESNRLVLKWQFENYSSLVDSKYSIDLQKSYNKSF